MTDDPEHTTPQGSPRRDDADAGHVVPSGAGRPADSVPSAAVPRQPEYGQVRTPEYGALASAYPPGYDPYLYGRPDSPRQDAGASPTAQAAGPSGAVTSDTPHRPEMFHGVDLADPRQNPLYGRWDSYAVLALVFALVGVPVLPAVMGGISLWRTRRFHMKGFGLAVAAIVVTVLITAVDLWMVMNGVSAETLLQWATGQSSSGTPGDSISA